MEKICAFFGHRDVWYKIDSDLENAIETAITQLGVTIFWCGGYGQFDDMAANMVRQFRGDYPDIKLYQVVAYSPKDAKKIFEKNDGFIYPKGLETVPQRFAITHRNRWMAEHCDMVICYVQRNSGGAYNACRVAHRKKKEIINLAYNGVQF